MNQNNNTLSVQGTGVVLKQPDIVCFHTTLIQRALTSSVALAKLNQNYQNLTQLFIDNDLDPKQLMTSTINITLINDHQFKAKEVECSQNVSFETALENDTLSKVLSALHFHNGFNLSLSYKYSETKQANNEALEKAVEDAKRSAEVIAVSAGVSLGSIQHIEYTNGSMNPFPLRTMSMDLSGSSINVEDLSFSQTVTITWYLSE